MIPTPTLTTFIMLIFGVSTFIFIMFLPALFELKKQKDAGPRLIMNDAPVMQTRMRKTVQIVNVEEEHRFDQVLIKKMADVMAVLPNIEA
jgi:hypothetical protein